MQGHATINLCANIRAYGAHSWAGCFALKDAVLWGSEGIQSHYDDAGRFDRPIYSLRLFSDSRLSFGTQLYGCACSRCPQMLAWRRRKTLVVALFGEALQPWSI